MRFKGLDLNLLVAFEVLMSTRSVSRSAEQLHLGQSAMSAALSRLRTFFGDDLLVAHGKRMHPTPFAESLLPQVIEGLRVFDGMLSTPVNFDPATSQRTFRIVASDYVIVSVLRPLVASLAASAPNVIIDISLPNEEALVLLDAGKIDLLITPNYVVSGDHPSEDLYDEKQLIVGWKHNPFFAGAMTEDDFFGCGHVAVSFGSQRVHSFADRQLEMLGRRRRIEVVAPFFTAVPSLLVGTMRLSILHERLVREVSNWFDLAWAELPFAMPAMHQRVFYHEARAQDAGMLWLKDELFRSVRAGIDSIVE